MESIGGNDCKVTNGKPTPPGSLATDPHQKDDRGDCVKDEKGKKISMTSTEEGRAEHLVLLEEKKIVHQDQLRKCTDDKSRFDDNK